MRKIVSAIFLLFTLFGVSAANAQAINGGPTTVYVPSVTDIQYGADPTGVKDSQSAFSSAIQNNCGKPINIPPGHYIFLSNIFTGTCAPVLMGNGEFSTFLDFSNAESTTATSPVLSTQGTFGTPVAITTANVLPNQTSLTVASATGFCQPPTAQPSPACYVFITSSAQVSADISPTHPVGEYRAIQSIVGNTINLYDAVEDTYCYNYPTGCPATNPVNTGGAFGTGTACAATACATPVALVSGVQLSNLTMIGPPGVNNNRGWQFKYGYYPIYTNIGMINFGGNGSFDDLDVIGASADHMDCFYNGVNTNSSGTNAYCFQDQDGTEYPTWSHLRCWASGPCYTQGNNSGSTTDGGVTRHISVSDSFAQTLSGINANAFQAHGSAYDIRMERNLVVNNNNSATPATHYNCYDFGSGEIRFKNNIAINCNNIGAKIWQLAYQNVAAEIDDNYINNTGSGACLQIIPNASSGALVFYSLHVSNNTLANCDDDGIQIEAGSPQSLNSIISDNTIRGINAGYCMDVEDLNYFVVSQNICYGTANTTTPVPSSMMYLLDDVGGTLSNNVVQVKSGVTEPAYYLACSSSGSGHDVTVSGNVGSGTNSSGSTGLKVDSNCQQEVILDNDFRQFGTQYSVGSTQTTSTLNPGSGCVLYQPCLLGVLFGANLATVGDQPIAIPSIGTCTGGTYTCVGVAGATRYKVTSIIATNCSVSATTATIGIYTQTGKTGTNLLGGAQAITGCNGTTNGAQSFSDGVSPSNFSNRFAANPLYLNPTVNQTGTVDIYILGVPEN